MALSAGTRLGSYEIVDLLGEGGMGEVYRATDTNLARQVAIKVLPDAWALDPDRVARFDREARTLATLNHPNIAAIYGLERSHGTTALVMELVEGPTLVDRIARGPVPVDEALAVARQIADALDAAHAKGIAHRDIKPANIKLTPEGRIKLLDFGLAKIVGTPQQALDGSTPQTVTAVTGAGQILGTPAYMSPEQARGEELDHRTDIWAFACVLYELLAGVRPFRGKTQPDLLAAVMERAPAWNELPAATPERVRALLRRCLEKEPGRRPAGIAEVRAAIEQVQSGHPGVSRRAVVVVAAGMLVGVMGIGIGLDAGGLRTRLAALGDTRPIRAIAVLPLLNTSGDPDQEYFADGATDGLIASLAKIGAIKVISRTSAMRYKRSGLSVTEIARQLDVDAVVEGSARRDGGRVLINANLIDATSDRSVWAESYERELAGILILHDDIARAIVQEIGAEVTPQEMTRLTTARRVDPVAYEAYQQGRARLLRQTPTEIDTAMAYFERARDTEPALGWAGIAMVWIVRGQFGFVPPTIAGPQARSAALAAAAIDDTIPEVHVVLGTLLAVNDWDWSGARRHFERALELNPNHAGSHTQFGRVVLSTLGEHTAALQHGARAMELDPQNPTYQWTQGQNLLFAGRYEEAVELLLKARTLLPGLGPIRVGLEGAYHALGRDDEVLQEERAWFEGRDDLEALAALDRGFAEGGFRGAMRRLADLVAARAQQVYVPPGEIVRLYEFAGDADQSLTWLERMVETRDPNAFGQVTAPASRQFWDDPRYRSIRERLGLAPLERP